MTLLAAGALDPKRFFKPGNNFIQHGSSFDLTIGHIYDDKGEPPLEASLQPVANDTSLGEIDLGGHKNEGTAPTHHAERRPKGHRTGNAGPTPRARPRSSLQTA